MMTQGEGDYLLARKETLPKPNHIATLPLDFQPLELWENIYVVKVPSLWRIIVPLTS